MYFLDGPLHFSEDFANTLGLALWGASIPAEKDLLRYGKGLRTLWPKLALGLGERRESESHYSEHRDLVQAYSAYYLTANAPKIPLVLEEAFGLGLPVFPDGGRWLDFGAGPGTALWGLAWWAKAHGTSFHFVGLEQSKEFVAKAGELSRGLRSYHPRHEAHFLRFRVGKAKALSDLLKEQDSDLVSFVNSFHEFFPSVEQKTEAGKILLDSLRWKHQRDGKVRWLLIVEPATRENSRQLLLALRSWQDQKLARLWLPCLSARTCGALQDPKDWCHEAADAVFPEWHESLGRAAGLRKESVLFSYALLSVGEPKISLPWPNHAFRMVSQRLEQKGQIECYFCSEKGKIRARVQRSKVMPETELFQRISRGEIFQELETADRGDVQKITPLFTKDEASSSIFPR